MNFPPKKRVKGHQIPAEPGLFDEDMDFTQDHLEQIDIIAPQALNGHLLSETMTSAAAQTTVKKHEEKMRSLKEEEKEILMKNGEIRVLRDSLKQANHSEEGAAAADPAGPGEGESSCWERT
ncbi:ATR-interacting protein-like [Carassius auratus]|uniref:ATR-interacting protein-like n=1 Tax=Carassius auratus TaxID=7957 RepID=A0A6P6NGN6_CARAU|nr:ATR-interacting protein-like [Carassius auratus]